MTEPDSEDPSRLFDDHPPASAEGQKPRRRRWLWAMIGLIVAIPIALTLAGALTSPPHVKGVPVGHLVYLDADEPSDHTAMLRGLRVMGPDGASRQILHEYEPQDIDAGSREWITQPRVSPNGSLLAFEKQLITLQEEEQSIDNQLWVMPLTGPNPQPRMLLDLTKQKLKQFVGLAWSADSKNIVFLQDAKQYVVSAATGSVSQHPLLDCLPLKVQPDISATRLTGIEASGKTRFALLQDANPLLTISTDGKQYAYLDLGSAQDLSSDWITMAGRPQPKDPISDNVQAKWGWSVFGKRRITALHWSPDGKYLAYSVSKPPFEDELFYVDLTTGKCFQLPVRTGRAGWDWGR